MSSRFINKATGNIKLFFTGKNKKIRRARRITYGFTAFVAIVVVAVILLLSLSGGNNKSTDIDNIKYISTITANGKSSVPMYGATMINNLNSTEFTMHISCVSAGEEVTYFDYSRVKDGNGYKSVLYDPSMGITFTVTGSNDSAVGTCDCSGSEEYSSEQIIDTVSNYSPYHTLGKYFDNGDLYCYEYDNRLFFFDYEYLPEDIYMYSDNQREKLETAYVYSDNGSGDYVKYTFNYTEQ